MATPMTAAEWRRTLKREGARFHCESGWTTHNRNHKGHWGPVHGVMIHHTAGVSSLELVRKGTADLPGPLAHAHLSKAGLVTMVSHGRANHAGRGSQRAYERVVADLPVPSKPDPDEVDGNVHFYGIEIENRGDGEDPYPLAQYAQAVKWAAAICRHHGWTEDSVIGHKEWTRRKIDPSFDMDRFRRDVAALLAREPQSDPKPPAPKPKPVKDPRDVALDDILSQLDGIRRRVEFLRKGEKP